MLANLLPGVRELRAPLVAGYIWVITIWIAVGSQFPDAATAEGFTARVYDLAHTVGRPALAVAASVAAYLIGGISESISTPLLKLASNAFAPLPMLGELPGWGPGDPSKRKLWIGRELPKIPVPLSRDGAQALNDTVVDHVLEWLVTSDPTQRNEPALGDLITATAPSVPDNLRREVVGERIEPGDLARIAMDLSLLPSRLLGAEPELYSAYDRLRAEGEFRAAVSIPLSAMIVALASVDTVYWIAALPLAAIIFHQGTKRMRQAGDVLAVALRARRAGVDSPVLSEVVKRETTKADEFAGSMVRTRAIRYRAIDAENRARENGDHDALVDAKRLRERVATNCDPSRRRERGATITEKKFWWPPELSSELRDTAYELALVLDKLGESEPALEWYRKAYDAQTPGAAQRLATLLLKRYGNSADVQTLTQYEQRNQADLYFVLESKSSWDMADDVVQIGSRYEQAGEAEVAVACYRAALSDDLPPSVARMTCGLSAEKPQNSLLLETMTEIGWDIMCKEDGWKADHIDRNGKRQRISVSLASDRSIDSFVREWSDGPERAFRR